MILSMCNWSCQTVPQGGMPAMMLCFFASRDLRIFMAIKHHEINTWQKSQKFNSRQISDVLTLTLANQMRLFRHFLSDIINGFFLTAVIRGIHRSKQNFGHAGSFCFRRRSSPLNTTEKHSQKTRRCCLRLDTIN